MKLIIAGSRSITDYDVVRQAMIESGLWKKHKTSIVVLNGTADGVDTLGKEFADRNGCESIAYPAAWDDIKAPGAKIKVQKSTGLMYNVLAGFWRNQDMANDADALLLIWDGKSTGSQDMLTRAKKKGLEIHAYRYQYGRLSRL